MKNLNTRRWSTPLTMGAGIFVVITGLLMFFVTESPFKFAHELVGIGFSVAVVLHVLTHWRSFSNYFVQRRAVSVLALAWAAGIGLVMASAILGTGEPEELILERIDRAPVNVLAPAIGMDVSDLVEGAALLRRRIFRLFIGVFCSRTVPFGALCAGTSAHGPFFGQPDRPDQRCLGASIRPTGPPPGHSRSVLVACRGKGDASEMAVVTTTRLSGRAFWVALGATSGRGRLDRRRHRAGETLKTVGVCPLVGNAQRRWRES